MANGISNLNNLNINTSYDPIKGAGKNDALGSILTGGAVNNTELQAYIDEKSAIFNKNSNYETFLRMVKNMPEILAQLTELIGFNEGILSTEYANQEFTDALMKLFDQSSMSKEELAAFLKEQVDGGTKFQNSLFDVLRNVLDKTDSQEVAVKILNFAKKYNDFSANKHVLKSMILDLKSMQDYMNKDGKAILETLTNRLNADADMGDVTQNLNTLRREVIPFLGNYIKATNDFGTLRDIITSVLLNTARYENGSKEGVLNAFQNLEGYNIIKKGLDDTFSIYGILREVELNESKPSGLDDTLAKILEMGIEGKGGFENIDAFKQVLTNMLMNESVYLPLIHLMFPININDTIFFSDLWIDPNDGKDGGGGEEERKIKLFLKFDIKELGAFDVVLYLRNNIMDLQVFAPEKVARVTKEVKKNVVRIVEDNGFRVGDVLVGKAERALTVLDVFPKIYEGKNSVNVRV